MGKLKVASGVGVLAVAGVLGAVGVAGASARPAPNTATYAITCANGFTGSVLVHRASVHAGGKITWAAGHIVGSSKKSGTKVLVPTTIALMYTFTPTSGTPVVTSENLTKKAFPGKQTVCVVSATSTVTGGTLAVGGAITGAFH